MRPTGGQNFGWQALREVVVELHFRPREGQESSTPQGSDPGEPTNTDKLETTMTTW